MANVSPSSVPHLVDTHGLELIGEVTRLQVQVRSLKVGDAPHRWYDPSGIELVDAITVDQHGVTGYRGGPIADIHNRTTANSRYRGNNGVSFGFETHYATMANRYGVHLMPGIAGENVLVRGNTSLRPKDLQHGLVIVTREGPLEFGNVIPAPPCVEFSRFCAGYTADQRSDVTIKETLQFLSDGTRGFYGEWIPTPAGSSRIQIGDVVYRRTEPFHASN